MHDTQLQLDLDTDFLKTEDGATWAVRITGTPDPSAPDVNTSVILHVAVENVTSNGPKSLVCEKQTEGKDGIEAVCRGEIAALGELELNVLGDAMNNLVYNTAVKSVQVPEDKIWQAKCTVPVDY
jgi:mannosyl-oligosaccharide glucosidase